MDLMRCLITAGLLVFSGQCLALFMPEGFTVSTDATAGSDEGCGVMITEPVKLEW